LEIAYNMKTIGEKIKSLRKEKDWSQEQLAFECGVSRQTISKWESNGILPSMDNLMMLSQVFEVEMGYFFNDSSESAENSTIETPVEAVEEVAVAEEKMPKAASNMQGKWELWLGINSIALVLFILNAVFVGLITSSHHKGDIVFNSSGLNIWNFYLAVIYCIMLAISEMFFISKLLNMQKCKALFTKCKQKLVDIFSKK